MQSRCLIAIIISLALASGCKSVNESSASEWREAKISEDLNLSNVTFLEQYNAVFMKAKFRNISQNPICIDKELIENKLTKEVIINIVYSGKKLKENYASGFITPRINDRKRIEPGEYFEGAYQVSGRFYIPGVFSEKKIDKIHLSFYVTDCKSNAGAKISTEWG